MRFEQNDLGLSIPVHIRAVETQSKEETVYRFIGMPYKGPIDGLFDLHGTYFAPDTQIGPLRTLPVFFEHGTFPEIEFDIMGEARIAGEDLEGRIFDVVVKKANEYHDFLERLYMEGLLFGSAQAFVSGYQVDYETGKLLKFIPAEWSFTVKPSNVLARPIEVLRSVFNPIDTNRVMEFYDMTKKSSSVGAAAYQPASNTVNLEQPEVSVGEVVRAADVAAATSESTTPVTETETTSILDRVNQALTPSTPENSETAVETGVTTGENVASITEALRSVLQEIGANQDVQRSLDNVAQRLADLEDALVHGIAAIADRVQGVETTIETIVLDMSEAEREVQRRNLARNRNTQRSVSGKVERRVATVEVMPPYVNLGG